MKQISHSPVFMEQRFSIKAIKKPFLVTGQKDPGFY